MKKYPTRRISTTTRMTAVAMALTVSLAMVISVSGFLTYRSASLEYHKDKAVAIASAAAATIDIDRLYVSINNSTPDAYWYELKEQMNTIFTQVEGLTFLYVISLYDNEHVVYYISAHRPGDPPFVYFGQIEEPGVYHKDTIYALQRGVISRRGIVEAGPWGRLVAGIVPVTGPDGQVFAFVGADIAATQVITATRHFAFVTTTIALIGAMLAGVILRVILKKSLYHSLKRITNNKDNLNNAEAEFRIRQSDATSSNGIALLYTGFAKIYNDLQQNIKERLKLEALLREEMESEREIGKRLQTMLDSAPLSVCMFDNAGIPIGCNQEAVRMFRLKEKEEFLDVNNLFMPDMQPDGRFSMDIYTHLMERARNEGYAHSEHMARRSSGDLFPCLCTFVRIPYMDTYVILEYAQDMTEIRQAMQREIEAEEENRAKSRFLAHMSHEIRTPMNAVMGISEKMLFTNNLNPETEDAFHRILVSSRLLMGIINDILDLSKVEANKMEIQNIKYDVAEMIVNTVQLNLMLIGKKQIDFKLYVHEGINKFLIGDEIRIKQIMNNLLSNAFKYTAEGTVKLIISIEEIPGSDNVMLVINVSDTGPGMTQLQIGKLFDIEYTRFNIDNHRTVEGSGLGMTIVKKLVNLMGGDIQVFSAPGSGTKVTVHIPQQPGGSELLGPDVTESLENLEITQSSLVKLEEFNFDPMPYGRVLVVDDVDSNLYVAKGLLMEFKLYVETAESAQQAIDKIQEGKTYDIIFMDHMMPGMNGIEATRILRDMGYTLPIIALTANALKGVGEMYLAHGFTGYISKPINVERLYALLCEFIRDKQPSAVLDALKTNET